MTHGGGALRNTKSLLGWLKLGWLEVPKIILQMFDIP